MAHSDKSTSSDSSTSSSSSVDFYGVITREGSASNGGWFEVQLDDAPDKKVYYRRGSMFKLKQPPLSAKQRTAAIPAQVATPASLVSSSSAHPTAVSGGAFVVPQAGHSQCVQGYSVSVPQSPVYLTCVSSQPLTPLSLPAGMEASSVFFYQTTSPHLTPLHLSPTSASATVSSTPTFTFATGRRASTGSLVEPMASPSQAQSLYSASAFSPSHSSSVVQRAVTPLVAVAQASRAQVSGGAQNHTGVGHVASPPLLLLHSPPLVSSLRATSTPVQLYHHTSPQSSVTSHGACVSLHPAGVTGSTVFEGGQAGRPSAFTSVGSSSSSSSPFSSQQPQFSIATATPPSPFALPISSAALVAPRALRLQQQPTAIPVASAPVRALLSPTALRSPVPQSPVPLHSAALSSPTSAATSPAVWPSAGTASAVNGRGRPVTPPYVGLSSSSGESKKRRRASLPDVEMSGGEGDAVMGEEMGSAAAAVAAARTASALRSSACQPHAVPVSLCQSVALCSL